MNEVLIFIIAFLLPMLYYRGLFQIYSNYFNKPFIRTKTGLQIHHLHHGIFLVFIAALILLFSGKNIYVVVLLGLGLGLMLDLFIPSILMKSDRKEELEVYKETLLKTVILFTLIVLFINLLSFFVR
ncbi:MAG: hypothetical protein ISS23_03630 [Nanoarchaeota archaeon]|nr:hypothetical protein [Nanoarchaeota archaeon]